MENSLYGNINLKDLGKSAIIAGGTVALGGILPLVDHGNWPTLIQLQGFASAGGCAAITYLIKMFLTNSGGNLGSNEVSSSPVKEVAQSTPVVSETPPV